MSKWLLQRRLWNSFESDWLWKLTLKNSCCSIFLFFANETFWKIWLTFLQKCLLSIVHTKLPKNLVSTTLVLAKSFVRRIFVQKNSELLLSHWDLQNVLPFHFLDISSCLLSDYLDKTFRVRAARNSAKAQSSGMFNRNKKKNPMRFFCILQYAIGSYHAFSGLDMNFARFCHP